VQSEFHADRGDEFQPQPQAQLEALVETAQVPQPVDGGAGAEVAGGASALEDAGADAGAAAGDGAGARDGAGDGAGDGADDGGIEGASAPATPQNAEAVEGGAPGALAGSHAVAQEQDLEARLAEISAATQMLRDEASGLDARLSVGPH